MLVELLLPCLLACVCALVLTGTLRRYALQSKLLDMPNSRSSHAVPTPRGGGMAIVVVVCLGLPLLAALGKLPWMDVLAIVPAAVAVAWVGFVDDRRGVRPATRFLVHLAAAVTFLLLLAGPPLLGIDWLDRAGWLSFAVVTVGLVWLLNLFNFMDGIDGIAGTELVCASLGMGLVASLAHSAAPASWFAFLLAGSSFGFLLLNWSPARIFMGDGGSGFAGIGLGMLALLTMRDFGLSIWIPAILLAAFVTDATVTLVRRALRGEKLHHAHRTHAYQWLSRRLRSHSLVVKMLLAVNLLWLWPLSFLAWQFPRHAMVMALVAYLPLIGIALVCRAGSPEAPAPAG